MVKIGFTVFAPVMVKVEGPDISAQEYLSGVPSGLDDPLPSSVAVLTGNTTLISAPALTVGVYAGFTLTVAVSLLLKPKLTKPKETYRLFKHSVMILRFMPLLMA